VKKLMLSLTVLALIGCDSSPKASKTQEQIQNEIVASQKKIAAEQRRIEKKMKPERKKLPNSEV